MHRSVYLPLLRGHDAASLEVFDFAEQGWSPAAATRPRSPRRPLPAQRPVRAPQSLALAERLLVAEPRWNDAARVDRGLPADAGPQARADESTRDAIISTPAQAEYLLHPPSRSSERTANEASGDCSRRPTRRPSAAPANQWRGQRASAGRRRSIRTRPDQTDESALKEEVIRSAVAASRLPPGPASARHCSARPSSATCK